MTGQCIRVLLIEDNPGDARLVQEALKGTSNPAYRVEWVDRLSSGLARLADGGIDVLLLDLGLPDSQGLAALALIRDVAPAVPVVVLSGDEDEQLGVEAVREGAQDYLVKSQTGHHLLARSLRYAIQRMRTDEVLRESEERLSLAMNVASEAIWEYHPATGFVQWSKTHGVTSALVEDTSTLNGRWIGRICDEDSERVTGSFFEALEGQGSSWKAEYRSLRPDGEWSYIRDRAIIARDSSGNVSRVIGAMLDVTDLKTSEKSLQESNGRLQRLSRDLLRAQDYERRRIARELHDSTSQLLAALSIALSRLKESALEPDRRRQVLAEASELAEDCATEIRTVTCLLHPPLLDEVGLASALRSYAHGFNQRTGIHVEIIVPLDFGRLSSDMETTLFRVVQEGLANVHKHSGSPLAVVRLERDPHEVRLVLQDSGRGLPTELFNEDHGFVRFGIGITGMRERAEQLGGRLELTSNDIGAKLTVILPLVHCDEEDSNTVGG